MDLIYMAGYRKDAYGWVPISHEQLEEHVGKRFYPQLRSILEELGIIECDHSSEEGEKCYRYRLTDSYEQEGATELPLSVGVARKQRVALAVLANRTSSARPAHVIIQQHLKQLTIDTDSAALILPDPNCRKWLAERESANAKRLKKGMPLLVRDGRPEAWAGQIRSINERRFPFGLDRVTGRIFHPLSNLAKPLRRGAARLGGLPIAEVDLSNSQPLLLGLLYPGPLSEEARRYRRLAADGRLYEHFAEINGLPCDGRNGERDTIKREFFMIIFGSAWTRQQSKLWPGLSLHFPELVAIIEGYAKNTLALALQRREADIMIGKVVIRLAAALPGIPFLSIHDAFAVPLGNEDVTKFVIQSVFHEETGIVPPVSIKTPVAHK